MVKLVLQLAVNGVMIVGLTLTGFWNNVALGLCWVLIAATPLMLVAMAAEDDQCKGWRLDLARRPRSRVYLGRAVDVATLVLLAGFAHWVTFVFYAAHALISLDCELKSEAELRSEHASPEKEPA